MALPAVALLAGILLGKWWGSSTAATSEPAIPLVDTASVPMAKKGPAPNTSRRDSPIETKKDFRQELQDTVTSSFLRRQLALKFQQAEPARTYCTLCHRPKDPTCACT